MRIQLHTYRFVVNTLLSIYNSMLQLLNTFSVNDLIENGTKSPIFFLFESPAPHSRDHLKNMFVASGDVRYYHVERSSKLTPK